MINWARVKELESDVGADAFGEVVELFLEEVEQVTNALRQAADGRDLASDMHFLKGSALNLGFDRLAQLCAEGERLATTAEADKVGIDEILLVYDASKREFLAQGPNDCNQIRNCDKASLSVMS
ncbi:MAG: Hpt domain-containing protein [Rhodobacteraceae bacterium]|nr:Hpt domain-containing protein [Paracoccaceae bacterium]